MMHFQMFPCPIRQLALNSCKLKILSGFSNSETLTSTREHEQKLFITHLHIESINLKWEMQKPPPTLLGLNSVSSEISRFCTKFQAHKNTKQQKTIMQRQVRFSPSLSLSWSLSVCVSDLFGGFRKFLNLVHERNAYIYQYTGQPL